MSALVASVFILASFSTFISCQHDSSLWVTPCEPRSEESFRLAWPKDERLKRKYAFNRVRSAAEDCIEALDEVLDSWSIFAFHDSFLELTKKFAFSIPTSYLPHITETKKIVYQPAIKYLFEKRQEVCQNLYLWLQKVTIAMLQLAEDSKKNYEPDSQLLNEALITLFWFLCEMDDLMLELGFPKLPDPDYSIMSDAERNPQSTMIRRIRDFNILREFLNMAQFAKDVMSDFRVQSDTAPL